MIENNKYKELYDQLVSNRVLNKLVKSKEELGKIESHHILPKCCGGSDDPKNIVNLYAKEHFMAHYYLWKIHENDEFRYQALCAFWNMCVMGSSNQDRTYQEFIKMSEEYQQARIEFAKQCSKVMSEKNNGSNNGAYGKHWYYDPLTNKSHMFLEGQQPNGWILGRRYTDRDAFVNAVSAANKKLGKRRKNKVIRLYNPITDEEIFHDKSLPIPNGFERRARPMSENAKRKLHEYYKKNAEVLAIKRIAELRPQYSYYLQNGWNKFVEKYQYTSSQQNFVMQCKRYLPEYKSRQGKRI